MGKLKDGFNDIFIYNEKKKKSKSMRIMISLFFIVVSVLMIYFAAMSIKLMEKKDVAAFGAGSANGEYVYMNISKLYSPCGYTSRLWFISGYYMIAETESNEHFIIYVSKKQWEELKYSEFFTDDSMIGKYMSFQNNYSVGTLSAMEQIVGERAVAYYKIHIDASCTASVEDYKEMFTPYFLSLNDRSALIEHYGIIALGVLIFGAVCFVWIMGIYKKTENAGKKPGAEKPEK